MEMSKTRDYQQQSVSGALDVDREIQQIDTAPSLARVAVAVNLWVFPLSL